VRGHVVLDRKALMEGDRHIGRHRSGCVLLASRIQRFARVAILFALATLH
jgi:hypothetical protein